MLKLKQAPKMHKYRKQHYFAGFLLRFQPLGQAPKIDASRELPYLSALHRSNDCGDDDDVQDDTKLKVYFNLHYWIDANVLSCRCHKHITPYTTFMMKWITTTKEKSELQETGTSSVSMETSTSLQ